jgi:diguanylate cyclase (GGDEF)-like protein
LVVAAIFFGGGVFVLMSVAISVGSVKEIDTIANRERHQALHDSLTGLPNRVLFVERLEQAISLAKREQEPFAVLLMDLDRFKVLNDTLGHHMGDSLLQELSPRLASSIRESDTVARVGGDEFAVLLNGSDERDATRVAEKIADAICRPFQIQDHGVDVGVSIGIVTYPDHGDDSLTLLRHADIAMYTAKRSAQPYAVYDIQANEYSVKGLELVWQVREALQQRQFSLVYQPKTTLQGGRLTGVEALARWHHPVHGDISPEVFIPIIEQLGQMHEMTLWVIGEALAQMRRWDEAGYPVDIAVNIAEKNICNSRFPEAVQKQIEQSGIVPSRLTLEIHENSMMSDPDQAHRVLTTLSNMGIRLSIDDFGTGYSSLSYLRHLPASEVKIDKSFVMGIMQDEDDAVIVCATIELSHNLGYDVVAEGIEDQDTLDMLALWNCNGAQGFHISHPLPADELIRWLETNPTRLPD